MLSPSTEAFDRGKKFTSYRQSTTLQEYVLIASDEIAVECFRKNDEDLWVLYTYGEGNILTLESVGAHGDWIRCVTFSPDGKLIASCGNDHTVRIWDSQTTKCLKILRGHTDWVWSVYFVWEKQWLISASSDRTAKVWSLDSGA